MRGTQQRIWQAKKTEHCGQLWRNPKKRMTKNNNENGAKIFYRQLAFAVFAALTPHRQFHA